jgi:hypothetical protein
MAPLRCLPSPTSLLRAVVLSVLMAALCPVAANAADYHHIADGARERAIETDKGGDQLSHETIHAEATRNVRMGGLPLGELGLLVAFLGLTAVAFRYVRRRHESSAEQEWPVMADANEPWPAGPPARQLPLSDYVSLRLTNGGAVEGWSRAGFSMQSGVFFLDPVARFDADGRRCAVSRVDSFVPRASVEAVEIKFSRGDTGASHHEGIK